MGLTSGIGDLKRGNSSTIYEDVIPHALKNICTPSPLVIKIQIIYSAYTDPLRTCVQMLIYVIDQIKSASSSACMRCLRLMSIKVTPCWIFVGALEQAHLFVHLITRGYLL